MSSDWAAVALGSVRQAHVERVLSDHGVGWASAAHVAATGSLAKAIRESHAIAATVANLIDVIVWAGVEDDLRLDISSFPPAGLLREEGPGEYQKVMRRWNAALAGRRINVSLHADLRLRRFLHSEASDRDAALILRRSLREFRRTIQTLIAADIRPADFRPGDALVRVATEAWGELERSVPALTAVRDDLWIDPHEYESQRTAHAKSLRLRIDEALGQVYGTPAQRRKIVYHGFYYFTPPQWALFQVLRRHPGVDQVFIIHDDGRNPAFESWRRFFTERWEMPAPAYVHVHEEPSAGAVALQQALAGERVDAGPLSGRIRVLECRTSTDFVRERTEELAGARRRDEPEPRIYAAGAADVDRIAKRLGSTADAEAVDLAHLPVGQYLLALHGCISTTTPDGQAALILRPDLLVDIASSGFLDSGNPETDPSERLGAIRRALPFFRGCQALPEWIQRAKALHDLVVSEVAPLGPAGGTQSDLDRIETAVGNPLRRAPWADLSEREALVILDTVRAIGRLVQEIAAHESRSISDHLEFIHSALKKGMQGLTEEQRAEIETKLRGASLGPDTQMDVDGLVDVVRMLLGREADFDSTGEEVETATTVQELRGLDALGLARSEGALHVANLADGIFPGRVAMVGWPFRSQDLLEVENRVPPVSMEIMKTRVDTAALSDLYLFWLALDGVAEGQRLTLSWIADAGNEPRNVSPVVAIIAEPSHRSADVKTRAGGAPIERLGANAYHRATRALPDPLAPAVSDSALANEVAEIDPRAAASAIACPRRFALQWALGPSAAFMSEHSQAMLFGNVLAALTVLRGVDEHDAAQACNDLWRYLTPAERASSQAKRVVKPRGTSAHGLWTLTLEGNGRDGDPLSRAYQAAKTGRAPSGRRVAPPESGVLPRRLRTDHDICRNCPVKPRCADAMTPEP